MPIASSAAAARYSESSNPTVGTSVVRTVAIHTRLCPIAELWGTAQRCSPFPRTRGRVSVGAGIDLVSISVCRMTPRDQTAFPDNSGRRHPAGGEVAHPERNRQVTNRLPRLTQRYGRSHAARTAASKLHHAGACCGLVDKRQSGRIKHAPLSHPTPTHLSQFDALLLRRL